jgi:hypothetical protein
VISKNQQILIFRDRGSSLQIMMYYLVRPLISISYLLLVQC